MPDHIVPLAHGGTDDDANIRCLCDEHHRVRTAEQFGHRVVTGCDAEGWPIEADPRDQLRSRPKRT